QKQLLNKIDNYNYNHLLSLADNRFKVILYNSRFSNSTNQWIHIKPNNVNGKKFSNVMFLLLLKRRFNIPIISSEQQCRKCNHTLDKYGDHALICKNGGDIIKRHDNIVKLLADEMHNIDIKHDIEPRNMCTG